MGRESGKFYNNRRKKFDFSFWRHYGERLKLHVGIILNIGSFRYYVPISSAKSKHKKMLNSLIFKNFKTDPTDISMQY